MHPILQKDSLDMSLGNYKIPRVEIEISKSFFKFFACTKFVIDLLAKARIVLEPRVSVRGSTKRHGESMKNLFHGCSQSTRE